MNLKAEIRNKEIVVSLNTEDISKRVDSAVFELVAIRLADKYVQEYGDFLLNNIIDVATLKQEVALIIKQRLTDETANKVSKP